MRIESIVMRDLEKRKFRIEKSLDLEFLKKSEDLDETKRKLFDSLNNSDQANYGK